MSPRENLEQQIATLERENTRLQQVLVAVMDSVYTAACPICSLKVLIAGGVIRSHMNAGKRCTASRESFLDTLRPLLALPSESPAPTSDKRALCQPDGPGPGEVLK